MRKALLIAAAACGAGLITAAAFAFAWRDSALDFGLHGWLAIGLGTAISVALAVGLMQLAYHSARAGYDARQKRDEVE